MQCLLNVWMDMDLCTESENKNTTTCSYDLNGEINNDNSEMVKV